MQVTGNYICAPQAYTDASAGAFQSGTWPPAGSIQADAQLPATLLEGIVQLLGTVVELLRGITGHSRTPLVAAHDATEANGLSAAGVQVASDAVVDALSNSVSGLLDKLGGTVGKFVSKLF